MRPHAYPALPIGTKVLFSYHGPLPSTVDPRVTEASKDPAEIVGYSEEGDQSIPIGDRADAGCGVVYNIRMSNGFLTAAFEDEVEKA